MEVQDRALYHTQSCRETESFYTVVRLSNRTRIALCSCSFTSSDMGTRFTSLHTLITAFASFGVTQRAWCANLHDRPGLTNARATNLTPPFSMLFLQCRHLARPVGAIPTQYLLARVWKPGVFCISLSLLTVPRARHMRPAHTSSRPCPRRELCRELCGSVHRLLNEAVRLALVVCG
jgi:hypothetical protein